MTAPALALRRSLLVFRHKHAAPTASAVWRVGAPCRALLPQQQQQIRRVQAKASQGDAAGDVHAGQSYYQQIGGERYKRAIIQACEKAVAGPRDGRISRHDAEEVLAQVTNGPKLTETEIKTAAYIMKNFTWTDSALRWFKEEYQKAKEAEDKRAATSGIHDTEK